MEEISNYKITEDEIITRKLKYGKYVFSQIICFIYEKLRRKNNEFILPSDLTKFIRCSRSNINEHLKFLEEEGVITINRFSTIREIKIKKEENGFYPIDKWYFFSLKKLRGEFIDKNEIVNFRTKGKQTSLTENNGDKNE
jgi:hypothetical protein